jgi:hypothetical protein
MASTLPLSLIKTLPPSSDYAFGFGAPLEIIWARTGDDTIVSYNPGAAGVGDPNIQDIDIILSDFEILLAGQAPTRRWRNEFVLGDWNGAYYIDEQQANPGLNSLAVLFDFNPRLDTIRLSGSQADYRLVTTNLGTALLYSKGQIIPDLIAFVPVKKLDLSEDYFKFIGSTSPAAVNTNIKQFGTEGLDRALSIASDSLGHVFVFGATTGALGDQSSPAEISDMFLTKFDTDGTQIWSQQIGTAAFDQGTTLTTDLEGNIYISGTTFGDLASPNQGSSDVYFAKLDTNGTLLWERQVAFDITTDAVSDIVIGDDGFIYSAGVVVRGEGSDDSWILKLDPDTGDTVWATEIGNPGVFDEAYGITTDSQGNVYAAGWTLGDFGGPNQGVYDGWLSKINENGELQWVEQFGSSDYEFVWGLDSDAAGNLYISGWTLGDLGSSSAGFYDVFLAKYDTEGNQLWIQQYGTEGDDAPWLNSLEVDDAGNIFLSGYTSGDFGGSNAGSYDAWVARFDADGNQQWIQQFGTEQLDYAYGLTLDDSGFVFATGITEGSLGGVNAGASDGWLAKLHAETGDLINLGLDVDFVAPDTDLVSPETIVGKTGFSLGQRSISFDETKFTKLYENAFLDALDQLSNKGLRSLGSESDFSRFSEFGA